MTEIQNRFRGYLNQQKPELNKSRYSSTPSFKGHKLVEKADGQKQFEMFLPNADDNIKLQLVKLHKDVNGRYTIPEHVDIEKDLETKTYNKSNGIVKVWTVTSKEGEKDVRYAYRFKKVGQPDAILDNTQKVRINGEEFNLTTDPSRPALALPHTMYHMMPDFFNPGKGFDSQTGNGILDFALKNLPRNHFNKYGGTINGITNKLDYIKDLGVARILSTPVMGQDRFPTGYWTTNPLQVTSTMGSFTDFKDMHKELYKRGMGWVADGAFVNEGWEGIHLKDVMLYGDKSPFYYWFETHNFPLEPIKPGILPTNAKVYKDDLGVKIVNGKQYVDKNGNPQKNDKFNPKMPTYIQVYDKSLITPDQLKDPNELIGDYQDKNYENNAKKSTYRDGVLQYSFEVKPNEIEGRIKDWKNANKVSNTPKKDPGFLDIIIDVFKFIFSIFGFTPGSSKNVENQKKLEDFLISYSKSGDRPDSALKLVKSDKDGGVTLWDGNKDIAKLRFVVPSGKKKELLRAGKTEELRKIERAAIQVQDNIIKVGGYWTNEVDKSLTEYSARAIGDKVKYLDKSEFNKVKPEIPDLKDKEFSELNPEDKYLAAIYILATTKADKPENFKGPYKKATVLPANLKDIIKKGELTSEHIKNMLATNLDLPEAKREYKGPVAPAPASIADGIINYPLDAIDFPAEVCSVLSSPYIKEIANTKDENGNLVFNINALDPDQQKIYESMQTLYKDRIVSTASDILKKADKDGKFFDGSELTQEGKQVFRLVSGDIVRFIMVESLANVAPKYNPDTKEFEYGDLREATFNNMAQFNRTSPKTAAKSVIYSIKEGLDNVKKDEDKFIESLSEKIENIDLDSIKAAKLVVNKTESGLDWRIDAAKDIADIDGIRDGKATFSESWEDVISFWKKFNTEVRTYNSKSYTIGEVTDVNKIMKKQMVPDGDGEKPVFDYNDECKANNGRFLDKNNQKNSPNYAEKLFIEETGFTTQSNYSYLYSTPHKVFHGMPEEKCDHGTNEDETVAHKPLSHVWWDMTNNFTDSGSIDNVNYSHTFFANHDKPRTFHSLTLDSEAFYDYKGKSKDDRGRNAVQESINAMNNALFDSINKASKDDSINQILQTKVNDKTVKEILVESIKDLTDSNKKDILKLDNYLASFDPKFYARRPFERNWNDIMLVAEKKGLKLDKDEKVALAKEKALEKAIHEEFIKPGINKFKAMMTTLTYMPGTPTLYAGDELAQTGYETKDKNVVRQNRERMKWEYIVEKENTDFRPQINKLMNDTANIINLRKDPKLSPLVDGYTINLDKQGDDHTVGIYRYNEDRDVVALLTNDGFNTDRGITTVDKTLNEIKLGNSDAKIGVKWNLGQTVEVNGFDGYKVAIYQGEDKLAHPVFYRRAVKEDEKIKDEEAMNIALEEAKKDNYYSEEFEAKERQRLEENLKVNQKFVLVQKGFDFYLVRVNKDWDIKSENGEYVVNSLTQIKPIKMDEAGLLLYREKTFAETPSVK